MLIGSGGFESFWMGLDGKLPAGYKQHGGERPASDFCPSLCVFVE